MLIKIMYQFNFDKHWLASYIALSAEFASPNSESCEVDAELLSRSRFSDGIDDSSSIHLEPFLARRWYKKLGQKGT